LAAELKQKYPDVQVRLVQASGGIFEVTADGQLVFSKKALRRHAAPGEVVQAIERLRGGK
jgi:selT/selW/selH-like putative selenoprotein